MAHGTAKPEDVEIEWQFDALDLLPVERWLARHASIAAAAPSGGGRVISIAPASPRLLLDSYLDTKDWRIARSGFVVRTRKRAGALEATLKSLSPSAAGLRERLEVTEVLPREGISGIDAAGPVARRVRALVGRRPLLSLLEVRTRRRPYVVMLGDEQVAEIALDDTTIHAGAVRHRLRLHRVEVEVDRASVDALSALVDQLRRECGLYPASLSKFEAGLLAAGLQIPPPPNFGSTAVSKDSSIGELAFAVLRREAAELVAHEPGARLGADAEELHQMRVATRRMRAALDLFADVLPVRARQLRSELGWLASVQGEVRDLDIQLERSTGWAAGMSDDARLALDELTELLEEDRGDAQSALLDAFDSRRYERLIADLSAMLLRGPALRLLRPRLPAATVMPDLVRDRHRAALRSAKRARRSGVAEDFHRLRIFCKHLRYALEFSAELYGDEPRRFARRIARLQDELGLMQDAEVAAASLWSLATRTTARDLSRATVFAIGGIAERYRNDARDRQAQMERHLRLLIGASWRRCAAVMEKRRAELAATTPIRPPLRAAPRPSPDEKASAQRPEATRGAALAPTASPAPEGPPPPTLALLPSARDVPTTHTAG